MVAGVIIAEAKGGGTGACDADAPRSNPSQLRGGQVWWDNRNDRNELPKKPLVLWNQL